MKENLKDILSNLHSETDQQTLLNYLQGKLSAEQQHEVEKNLLDHEFEAEALEGLQDFKDNRNISALVEALNNDLKKKTTRKKAWRQRRHLKSDPWLLLTVGILLVLVVLTYFIIHLMNK